jgi:phosphoribosylamine--glycine ligase
VIHGLGDDGQLESPIEGVVIFHAGTKRDERGRFVTAGGRVLAVTGVAATMTEAHRRAYRGASLVTFEGKVTRSDIAQSVI